MIQKLKLWEYLDSTLNLKMICVFIKNIKIKKWKKKISKSHEKTKNVSNLKVIKTVFQGDHWRLPTVAVITRLSANTFTYTSCIHQVFYSFFALQCFFFLSFSVSFIFIFYILSLSFIYFFKLLQTTNL